MPPEYQQRSSPSGAVKVTSIFSMGSFEMFSAFAAGARNGSGTRDDQENSVQVAAFVGAAVEHLDRSAGSGEGQHSVLEILIRRVVDDAVAGHHLDGTDAGRPPGALKLDQYQG